jgi:competence protein ComEC
MLAGLRARGIPIRRPRELCRLRRVGGAELQVLAPCPGPSPDVGANDNSFVLRLGLGARALLLVGDSEHEAEQGLIASGAPRLKADVLKVGHHGSRTSTTPAFVAAVQPSTALISCGVRNRYGHPHPQTLATLRAAGLEVLRTDRGGGIEWRTRGSEVELVRMGLVSRF